MNFKWSFSELGFVFLYTLCEVHKHKRKGSFCRDVFEALRTCLFGHVDLNVDSQFNSILIVKSFLMFKHVKIGC